MPNVVDVYHAISSIINLVFYSILALLLSFRRSDLADGAACPLKAVVQ